ncbi:hypothetical protein T5B8_11681 [Salinisphaera sp. T5B8]
MHAAVWALAMCLLACSTLVFAAADDPRDPLDSSRWRYMRAAHFRDAPVVFDERVQVWVPGAADNSGTTPVQIRAPGLDDVVQIRVIADANADSRVLDYFPVGAQAAIGFSLVVEQATPLRAAMRTGDGVWHIGGRWVDAEGGGCAPASVIPTVDLTAGTQPVIAAHRWARHENSQRLKFRIRLPASGTPARSTEQMTVRDDASDVRVRIVAGTSLDTASVFTLDIDSRAPLQIEARDTTGQRYRTRVWQPLDEASR